jgi:hypothetical protein
VPPLVVEPEEEKLEEDLGDNNEITKRTRRKSIDEIIDLENSEVQIKYNYLPKVFKISELDPHCVMNNSF